MKAVAYIFPLTAVIIFVQTITGAATVLDFYEIGGHMDAGSITGVFVLVATIVAFATKPKYNALRYSSLALLILVILQGLVGFSAETSDQLVLGHFVIALVIFSISIATVFYSFRWNRVEAGPSTLLRD